MMSCPRCNVPAEEETLREFGGVCPKCLLDFSEEKDAPAFPNLEILEMLGQGGMGVVYKAKQKNLDRLVALKVLSPHLSEDREFVERFTREAKALAQLNHPNIVGIYDSGIHDRVPYLVMEYVDGTPLRTLLASPKLTPDRVLEVIPQICDALHYAHAHGVVHRDIKPENILVDRKGKVKIADFGIAKLASVDETRITKTGYVMGSPHYMAPEQMRNSGQVDHRADIYSLGVVFYEMLTGELPLGRFKPPSEKSAADRRLDPVVLKSLEREPEDRWQTADEVKSRVLRLEDEAAPRTRPGRMLGLAIGFSAAILVVGLGVVLLAGRGSSVPSGPSPIATGGVVVMLIVAGLVGARRKRRARAGRTRRDLVWVAIGAAVAVLIVTCILFLVPSSAPAPVAVETRPQPQLREARRLWSEDVAATDPVLGLLSTPHSLHVVASSEIRDYAPETGQYLARWAGSIGSLPVVDDEWMALWGDGKIVLLRDQGSGLVEKARLDIPFRNGVAGAGIVGGVYYLQSLKGDAAAVDLNTGKVLWTSAAPSRLGVSAGVPPIITDLDVLTIHDGGLELRDRKTGVPKNSSPLLLPEGKVLQWEKGWGVLHQKGINVSFQTYYKSMVREWWAMNTTTTPALADCHMVLVRDLVVLTTVNQIFSVHRNAPFQRDWGGEALPHTVGPLAVFDKDYVAVPTVEGVLLFSARNGARMDATIPGKGELSFVSGCGKVLAGFDAKAKRLAAYTIE
ncbi:MAG: protein kinase [Planctomycetaceae bacterium]|nr:protein kinase [Planctomycetaceae bacterium]